MPPLTYGHFQVETDAAGLPVRLGPGGMGTTYRAFDTHLRRAVALKVIDDRRLADPISRRRFFKEARTAAQLEHPNIARVLYLSPEDAKTCFFAMELVEGESLNERLSRLGPCAPHEALALLRQVVDALACLGQNKLVHRDIKPDNIMLGTDPRERLRVKLIDFGLAKSTDSQPTILETDSNEHFIGSTYFASPEQVRSAGTLDHRSDFYSLGATLWHTLTGMPPFIGGNFEIQEAHVGREPPWEKVAHLPEPLRQLLRALLAKDPGARPADAAALARLWDSALAALPPRTPSPTADGRTAADPPAARLRWKRAEAVPYGCSEPPSSGFLARDSDSAAWYFIRGLPPSLPASLRAELLAAATRAMEAGHAAVRRVLEVGDDHIISEWECSLSLAELLAERGKPLPLAILLAWLPSLAEAVHFASTRQLSGLSLQLSRVWLEFQQPEAARSPQKTALLPPEKWGTHRVRLDPLGAFDPMLEALIGRGAIPETLRAATKVAADPLPHLAVAIYRLLGGQEPPPGMPLPPAPGVDAARNRLLVDAIEGRTDAATVPEWAALLLRQSPDPPPPAERPVPPPPPTRHAKPSPPWPVKTSALAAGLCLLAAAIVFASKGRPPVKPAPASPGARIAAEKVTPAATATPVSQAKASGDTLWQNQSGPILGTPPVFRIATPVPSPPALPPADYVNSLEMRFKKCKIVAGYDKTSVLASIWETRNRDYQAFARATKHALPLAVKDLSAEAPYPVVMVSWKEARDFCVWLTRKEIQEGRLKSTSRYRLPTDHEWSSFVGIAGMNDEHPGLPLAQKNCMILGIYGWGSKWPPPPGAGNLADTSFGRLGTNLKPIANYEDGYAGTAPVGSFPPNSLGLFDLAGNVAEWCRDSADNEGTFIIRGSAFNTNGPMKLLASYRDTQPATYRAAHVGFRVVLEQPLP
ncbi:MAG: eukaryotic-like serine/threonine-protein kinase [Chthoniobacter sp.]|jgi:serine/threonine protein kinase|nr:eukaryotic-like serine/threonine-protein kinase [Chthoniobacter sp.]